MWCWHKHMLCICMHTCPLGKSPYLKPRVHDKRLYGTGIISRSLLLIIPSEICLRAKFPVSVHEYLRRKNMVSHWPIPSIQPPLHSQSPYVNQNGNADAYYVCSDWLVCCAGSTYAPLEIRTAILNRAMDHWTPWMDPRSCSLVRWTRILRIQQHIVWDESRGST